MSEPKTAEVKVVPVEPTEAMIAAGERAAWDDNNSMPAIRAMPKAWSAMLAASPPAETGEGVDLAAEALQWRENVTLLRNEPDTDVVRVREGGGAEDLIMSLVVTMAKTRKNRNALSAQPVSPSEGEDRKSLSNLKAQLERIAALSPNDQPHYPWGSRPFGTGDLAHFISVLDRALTHPASDQSDTERMRAVTPELAAEFANIDGPWTRGQMEMDEVWSRLIEAQIEGLKRAALAEKAADR